MSRSIPVATMNSRTTVLLSNKKSAMRTETSCSYTATQVLQSETGEADRQTYSLFRESSSVALQTSTDLKSLKVVAMARRIVAQEHSAAHVQLASCISAIVKFGAGADDDPFVKVNVQRTSASQEQTSCLNLTMRLDRIGAAVLNTSPVTTRLLPRCSEQCLAAQVDQSGQKYVSDRVTVHVRSNDQHLFFCARANG